MTTLQSRLKEMYHEEEDIERKAVLKNAYIKLQAYEQIIIAHEELDDKICDAASLALEIDEEMDAMELAR